MISQFVILIIVLGSFQGLILSFVLGRTKIFNKTSNRFLAIFILAFSLSNLHYVAHIVGLIEQYSWLNYLSFPWTFLIPVVFYFFIVFLLNPDYELERRDKYLFLPFVFQCVFHLTLFLLDIFDVTLSIEQKDLISFFDVKMETVCSLLLNLIFIPLVYNKLTKYESKLMDNYSEISHKSVAWLRHLVLALIGIWVLWTLPAMYQILTGVTTPTLDLILWLLMSICIYWIGFASYFRRDIFLPERLFPSDVSNDFVQAKMLPGYSAKDGSALTSDEGLRSEVAKSETATIPNPVQSDKTDQHFKRMIKIIEEEKLYQNPEFNLSMLSEKIQLSANYISQFINKKTDGNFYNLINNYRVQEAKKMIASAEFDHYTLVGIGLEAGFKSKSSFYKIFKERTKTTPNQFKKNLK